VNRFFQILVALTAGFLLVSWVQAATFTPLGELPDDFDSNANGVSADGSVVVGESLQCLDLRCLSGQLFDAWRWTSEGGMVRFGDLLKSTATGVSADGSAVVGTDYIAPAAWRWTSGSGVVGLGGSSSSRASGVSADGSVVVGTGNGEAFRWTRDNGMVGLGDLLGGIASSTASGLSADGNVVVGRSDSEVGDYEAFRWTSDSGMVGLGFLPGGFYSFALGVSADGSVVVGSSDSAAGRVSEAFRWTSDGDMVGLGFLPGGSNDSQATGVSADGRVVVGSSGSFPGEAFIWTQTDGMERLIDVIAANGATGLSDWTLRTASAISPDGQWIVGQALSPSGVLGAYRARLEVPVVARFNDVPTDFWAFSFIETLADNGVTSGCGNDNYCPEDPVSRAQMAVFLERGINGSDFVPTAATGNAFLDVGAGDFAANFIEQLASDGITAGCGNNNYCPDAEVTRAQMAVFLLRAKYGAGYSPPTATGVFSDVDLGYWAVHWIEQLASEGITSGCGNNNYCPDAQVTRDQMAVFLVRTFGL